jgi:hypothetical protein
MQGFHAVSFIGYLSLAADGAGSVLTMNEHQ